MHSSAIIALLIVSLDAMGLGLIMPVFPTLLRELVPAEQVAGHYGALLSLYALMQVIFAPCLDSFQMLTVGVRCFWLLLRGPQSITRLWHQRRSYGFSISAESFPASREQPEP